MTYTPLPPANKRPRSHDRPHLNLLSAIFQMLMYGGVGFAILFVVISIIADDPSAIGAAAGLLGGSLVCGIGWVVVYIARTLDDIGYAVGAPPNQLPLPPPHATP